MLEHTPGPWTMQPIGDETECNILGKHRELVATVSDNDARLIAKAPEMLALLTQILAVSESGALQGMHPHGPTAEIIRALLAEIEGGTNHAG